MATFQENDVLYKSIIARKLSKCSGSQIHRDLQPQFPNLTYKTVLAIIRSYSLLRNGQKISRKKSIKFNFLEMREIRNFIRDAYSINNELTAPALCKKIENELGYEVKLTMLKKLRRELGFICKSTKCGHLIRPANKKNDFSSALECWR
uniref:HTH_33 domain-containing protein n=1 Tax=Heterorhabditis bacteriophora TaxID=37862 RepID=A0A1I7XM94_HETBA